MARIPTDTRRRSFTDPNAGRTPIDPRQIESAWNDIARAGEGLRGAIDRGLVQKGQEEGAKAVARDENGNITVERPGFAGALFPEFAAARRHAALAAYMAESEMDIRKKLGELRNETPTDAAAFNTKAMAFAREMRDKAQAGFGPQVFQMATREAERVSRGIQATAERVELQKHKGAMLASINATESDLLALSRQGAADTPEFAAMVDDLNKKWDTLTANDLFGVSREEADLRIRNLKSRVTLEASSSSVLGVYAQKGELPAIEYARKVADHLPGLTEPQREEWIADQKQRINEREAAKNKALAGVRRVNARHIADAEATLAAGNDATSLLNDPNLFAGFKPDEVQAAQERLAAAKRAGQARKALLGADPAERKKIVDSFVVSGPGARLTARYKASLQTEAAAIDRTLNKDPVAQVVKSDPELVSNLGTALRDGDAQGFADAADALVEEQHRLGALNPRLLSTAQRKAIVSNLVGQPDDPDRVSHLVEGVQKLNETAGMHFPRLMAELAQEHDFPAAAYGVGFVEGNDRAQHLLAKAALEDQKVLRDNVGKLGTGAIHALRDDLSKAVAPLTQSLAASGMSQTQIAKVTDSVEALASQFAVENGKTAGAAKKAFKAMFGNYHFEGSYRLPPTYHSRVTGRDMPVSPDLVRLGISDMMDRLQGSDFIVPHMDPRLPAKGQQRAYISHLRSHGQWVTNPDETGLILVNGAGQPVMERPINHGEAPQVFEVSFDQLEALGRGQREERVKGAQFGNTPLPRATQ